MRDEDLPFFASLYASTRAEEVAQTGWPIEAQQAFIAQQFEAQHRHYMAHYPDAEWLVIERAGAAAGRLYLEEWPSQLRIIDIIVGAGHRGIGLGGAILADVLAMAAASGKEVSIHVEAHNPAKRLYERLGFRFVESNGVYELMHWSPEAGAEAAAARVS